MARSASVICERVADFGMKPAAPNASARRIVTASSLAETTATGTAGNSPRTAARPAKPSTSDSFRSSSSRSTDRADNARLASARLSHSSMRASGAACISAEASAARNSG